MATTLITIGPAFTMIAGVVYALPARKTRVRVQQTGGTIEVSNDGVTYAAVTLDANFGFETVATFIRAMTTNAIITMGV